MPARPDTVPNCASWPRNSPLSSGLNGSWFLSCVTMRFKNSSWPSSFFFSACGGERPSWPKSKPLTAETIVHSAPLALTESQGPEHQGLGRVDDLEVALIRARGGDHVRHLFHCVHVRRIDHAVLVRLRVARVVALDRRRDALGDAEHVDARERVAESTGGAKQRLARAIDVGGIARDVVHVREVARGQVQTERLRGERGAGDIERAEGAHERVPASAVRSVWMRPLANSRLA